MESFKIRNHIHLISDYFKKTVKKSILALAQISEYLEK